MVTEEDRVAIKCLRQNKGYSARVNEFLLKMEHWWFEQTLKKIDYADSDIRHFMFTSQVIKLMLPPSFYSFNFIITQNS